MNLEITEPMQGWNCYPIAPMSLESINYEALATNFTDCVSNINIEGNYLFKLLDLDGFLIKGFASKNSQVCNEFSHKVSARTHYCWHSYETPLIKDGKIFGYLNLSFYGPGISKELMVITDLLAFQIIQLFQNVRPQTETPKAKLTDKQVEILKLLSQGLTEEAVASELRLSVNTIKYHKKIIFDKLGVKCSTEAIVEAIRLKLIPM